MIAEVDDIEQQVIRDAAINHQLLTEPCFYFIQASRCCLNDDQGTTGAYVLTVTVRKDK